MKFTAQVINFAPPLPSTKVSTSKYWLINNRNMNLAEPHKAWGKDPTRIVKPFLKSFPPKMKTTKCLAKQKKTKARKVKTEGR